MVSAAHMIRYAFVLLTLFATLSPAAAPPAPAPGVSRALAQDRARAISGLRYQLTLTVGTGSEDVTGTAVIHFRIQEAGSGVILDFRDQDAAGRVLNGRLQSVSINGSPAHGIRQVNGHIVIPAGLLAPGENEARITFASAIAAAGRPYIRYLDKDDNSEYVYTLLVPMDASLAFPCFDQPDLKGVFTLRLTTPGTWKAISNAPVESTSPAGPGRQTTTFQKTKPISTYVFAFAAGPFRELAAPPDPVPYRLLVRRSKLERAQDEWPEVLRVTRGGLQHLAAFFDYPFPFPKYDQVLLPGLAYGGMEHAGATFLREESVLFRSTPAAADLAHRNQLLLHELTHQWFGDLVTMRWFDDLWLKEGFATYMGYQAEAAMEPPDAVWKRFYESTKTAAYAIDATPGTTPVHQVLDNLIDAKSAYGAIVYSKAPGLLRSLSSTIGETAFRDGLRSYLKRHQYANASWDDLIDALSGACGRPLKPWADAWMNRRGMPEVTAAWDCGSNGRIESFRIRQRDVLGEGGVWPIGNRIRLAYDSQPPVLIEMSFATPSEPVPAAVGKPCPAYVFLNDGDLAYGRFPLDVRSQSAVLDRVGATPNPFLRSLLWGALWDAVREAQLPPSTFLRTAVKDLPSEGDEELAQSLAASLGTAYRDYLTDPQREEFAPAVEGLLLDLMKYAPALGLRITYFRTFCSMASTPAARLVLKSLLAGRDSIPGLALKPADRWRIIAALAARGDPGAGRLLDEEKARDRTGDGRRFAYTAAAAERSPQIKQRYFEDYTGGRSVPEDWMTGSLDAFNSWDQSTLTFPYLGTSLALLPQVKRQRKIFFLTAWLNAFLGGQHSPEALAVVDEFLKQPGLDNDLRLKVLQARDGLERTVRIRARFGL